MNIYKYQERRAAFGHSGSSTYNSPGKYKQPNKKCFNDNLPCGASSAISSKKPCILARLLHGTEGVGGDGVEVAAAPIVITRPEGGA